VENGIPLNTSTGYTNWQQVLKVNTACVQTLNKLQSKQSSRKKRKKNSWGLKVKVWLRVTTSAVRMCLTNI